MKLTIKEAIEQGYTKYGFGGREWQTTNDLHDDVFEEVEEEDWNDIVLFEKESKQTSISALEISELLSDLIGERDSEDCGRDDDCVYDAIKAIDYTSITDKINEELGKHKYWVLTDISIVQNK